MIEPAAQEEVAMIEPAVQEEAAMIEPAVQEEAASSKEREPPIMTDKSTQDDIAATAKMFLRKMAAPREEPLPEK